MKIYGIGDVRAALRIPNFDWSALFLAGLPPVMEPVVAMGKVAVGPRAGLDSVVV